MQKVEINASLLFGSLCACTHFTAAAQSYSTNPKAVYAATRRSSAIRQRVLHDITSCIAVLAGLVLEKETEGGYAVCDG